MGILSPMALYSPTAEDKNTSDIHDRRSISMVTSTKRQQFFHFAGTVELEHSVEGDDINWTRVSKYL